MSRGLTTRILKFVPGGHAWRQRAYSRAVFHFVLAAGLLCLEIITVPRLLQIWIFSSLECWVAGLTLLVLPALLLWMVSRGSAVNHSASQGSTTAVVGKLMSDFSIRLGGILIVALLLMALLAPLLTTQDPVAFGDIALSRYLPPSAEHPMGTDQFGRDVYSRLLFGARVSLAVGLITALWAITIGTLVGLLAGYLGKWVDAILMRSIDILIAFPRLFLVLLVVSLTKPSIWTVIVVLALTGWMATARLVRAEVLRLREQEYVQAVQALGFSKVRILWRHVLPNVLAPIIVSATLMVGNVILAESFLSFLGLGVQIPTPSWGSMIDEGRKVFPSVWWLASFPGLAITLTVVGFNLLGDGLRDALDPQDTKKQR